MKVALYDPEGVPPTSWPVSRRNSPGDPPAEVQLMVEVQLLPLVIVLGLGDAETWPVGLPRTNTDARRVELELLDAALGSK